MRRGTLVRFSCPEAGTVVGRVMLYTPECCLIKRRPVTVGGDGVFIRSPDDIEVL